MSEMVLIALQIKWVMKHELAALRLPLSALSRRLKNTLAKTDSQRPTCLTDATQVLQCQLYLWVCITGALGAGEKAIFERAWFRRRAADLVKTMQLTTSEEVRRVLRCFHVDHVEVDGTFKALTETLVSSNGPHDRGETSAAGAWKSYSL